MIDRHPSDMTGWYDYEIYRDGRAPEPMLVDVWPERQSTVLGPDGEPLRYNVPRRKMGFDLRSNKDLSLTIHKERGQ